MSHALWKVYLDPRQLSKVDRRGAVIPIPSQVSRLGFYELCDPELIPQPSRSLVSSSAQLGWFPKAVIRTI